jgi:hypothetical protein
MIPAHERNNRIKMTLLSAAAYALVMAVVLWFDRGNLQALGREHIQFVVHAHLFLAAAFVVWILGYERFNPLVAAALFVDILIIARDRVSWAAVIVAALAITSCVYATVRNVSNARQKEEQANGT